MNVKLFTRKESYNPWGRPATLVLEDEINAWLDAHPNLKLHTIRQSMSAGGLDVNQILVAVWYER